MSLSHRMSHTRTYRIWSGMIQRCTNPRRVKFKVYGGRGISVCEEWLRFEFFMRDMGEAPDGLSIDRIDPNGNYEPSNCRWTTNTQQARNRTDNYLVTAFGITRPVADWADETGLDASAIRARIERLGWFAEAAVCTPSSQAMTRYRGGTLRDFRSINPRMKKLGNEPINEAPKVTVKVDK